MASSKGRKPTSGRGGAKGGASARAKDPAALRRLALLAFGAAFVLLFVIVAIAEGIGDPSIPDGDVALVEEAPEDSGNISQAEFDKALAQSAAQSGKKEIPKPDSPEYDELSEAALGSLLDAVWLKGQAAEMGITVTPAEVAKEFKKLKDENFKTEAEYRKFLKDSNFTQADVDARVELQMLSSEIQTRITDGVAEPSESDIENYYEAAKPTQFTQPATRDIRLIVNKDKAKAEAALAALEKDSSATSWKTVAKKYSEDDLTKTKGGLQKGLGEGSLEEPLNELVFETPEDRVEGPVKTQRGYNVFVVENTTEEEVQELETVESQIKTQLEQQAEQEAFTTFVAGYTSRWQSRTFCADDYVMERCSNYKAAAHPATAPPACYEADPKKPAEACPAPVFQLIPALPGTVSPVEPRGTPLAQRPTPGTAEAAAAPPASPLPVPAP
jgi:parvulin-like peptidyl-prolyl isomerase